MTQIWYITGCTSGTGLALSEKLLSLGHKVAGTSRNLSKVSKLDIAKNPNFLALEVDLVNEKSVQDSINKTIEHFKGLTHVINNAGYGLSGSVEEISDKEHRELFDTLYFGPLNVIRAVLPYFRSKKDGYIFNVSSGAGFKGLPRFGAYCGVKFAVTGMTESLAEDVKPFNIKVANIILGLFKTNFQSAMDICSNLIDEYDTNGFMEKRRETLKNLESGNPERFAEILIEYSTKNDLPCNIFIGTPSNFVNSENKVKQLSEQIATQKERNSNVVDK